MEHWKEYRGCEISWRDRPWSHLLGSPQFRGSVACLLAWYHGIIRIACLVWGLPMLFLFFSIKSINLFIQLVRGIGSLSVKQDVLHNFAKKHLFCLCSVSVLMLSYNSFSDIFSSFNIFLRWTCCFWNILSSFSEIHVCNKDLKSSIV